MHARVEGRRATLLVIAVIACLAAAVAVARRRSAPRAPLDGFSLDAIEIGFPMRRVVTWPDEAPLNVVALNAPFRELSHEMQFRALRARRVCMIGFTHYQEFPGKIVNPHEDTYHTRHPFDYVGACDAWAYCFRDPAAYGVRHARMIEMVESDFVDIDSLVSYAPTPKRYDYAYVCLADGWNECSVGWQAHCRNWPLALRCIEAFSAAGLRGLLVGRRVCASQLSGAAQTRVRLTGMLPHWEFVAQLASCRVLFVPNVSDASPRVVTEALSMDVGVLMNEHILGGWKYVDPACGELFDGRHVDCVERARDAMLRLADPRRHIDAGEFRRAWGRRVAARRFGAFLRGIGVPCPSTGAYIKV